MCYVGRINSIWTFIESEVITLIIKADVDKFKANFSKCMIGQRVRLTSNGGRKRLIVYEGVVEGCYPNVFSVRYTRPDAKDDVVSYSYVDVLTGKVKIFKLMEKGEEQAS